MAKTKSGFQTNIKGPKDLVTEVDFAVEKLLTTEIKKKFPSHGILAEEKHSKIISEKYEYIWVIDPIDGTKNFSHGIPEYSISIGLLHKQKPLLGIVYAPALNKLYTAQKNHGAFLNGKRIHVSKVNKLKDGVFLTGFPRNQYKANFPYFKAMMKFSQGIRHTGSAALELASVAKGESDGCWYLNLNSWDFCAGTLLVTEAGGRVTSTDGSPLDIFGNTVLATNGLIHKETVEIFKKIR